MPSLWSCELKEANALFELFLALFLGNILSFASTSIARRWGAASVFACVLLELIHCDLRGYSPSLMHGLFADLVLY